MDSQQRTATNGQYVQFGCGLCAPSTWRNFDISPTLRLQQTPVIDQLFKSRFWVARGFPVFAANVEYGDIVKGLPVEPNSCRAIYCSHVLEHLALDDFRCALRNIYSLLAPDGIFRLVVPDLETLAKTYLASTETTAASQFMEQAFLGKKTRQHGLGGLVRAWLGNSDHLWMWDFKAMAAELAQAGFSAVRPAQFGDSSEPRFRDVEEVGRWEGCLGLECHK